MIRSFSSLASSEIRLSNRHLTAWYTEGAREHTLSLLENQKQAKKVCTTEPIDILLDSEKNFIAEKRFKRFHEFDFVHFPSLTTVTGQSSHRCRRRRCMIMVFSQSTLKIDVKTSFQNKSEGKNWRRSLEKRKRNERKIGQKKIDNRYVCAVVDTLYNFIDEKSTNHEKERTSSQNGNNIILISEE